MVFYNPNGDVKIFMFSLSTCVHCRRSKTLLNEMGIKYDNVDIDTLSETQEAEVLEEISRYNPARTFPTIIINSRVIVGYKPDDIRQEINKIKKSDK